jgi:hypothetical protein
MSSVFSGPDYSFMVLLRPHLIKNIDQHYQALKAFHGKQHELDDYLEWFKSLSIFYEDDQLRARSYWWTSTSVDSFDAMSRSLYFNDGNAFRGGDDKIFGFSVRCIKD